MTDALLGDERAVTWRDRMVGILGPRSSSFTLAWLASHRGRLRTVILGGHRLSILVVWDCDGQKRVARTDAEVDAIRLIVNGAP